AARLAGEGRTARLHRPGADARRLRRLLPRVGDAALDAADREGLAGDLRAPRRSRVDRQRRRDGVGRRVATDRDRDLLDPAGPCDLPGRRAAREAVREVEALRLMSAIGLPIETERLLIRPLRLEDAEDLQQPTDWIKEKVDRFERDGGMSLW